MEPVKSELTALTLRHPIHRVNQIDKDKDGLLERVFVLKFARRR